MDNLREGIKTWLRIQPAQLPSINLQEILNYDGNAIKNRIWYNGVSEELKELYGQLPGDKTKFWAAVPTAGMEIRKIHVGIPAITVDTLANIIVSDFQNINLSKNDDIWEQIEKENNIKDLIEEVVTETLVIGDGAFKVSVDTSISDYPILEFYPGDKIDIVNTRGRVCEIVFKTVYNVKDKEYVLLEKYGKGYIKYTLTKDGKECPLNSIEETKDLTDIVWDGNFMLAEPFRVFKSNKWKGRGKSIFDNKCEEYDSLDETWSQWMDALRANRTKEYIPESLLPRNPNNGEILAPNAFDNRYIKTDSPMNEGSQAKISLEQGEIHHESYLSTYITALDMCLQGIISPSTIGIDVKKLDNAEAQREKEKATLYTRNKIIERLREAIPNVVDKALKAYALTTKTSIEDAEVEVAFGEYANPSFESQVETVSKGKQGGVMSTEAAIDELYGDSKDEEWKKIEVARIKAEQGIAEVEEPGLNLEGVNIDEGIGEQEIVPNVESGIQ